MPIELANSLIWTLSLSVLAYVAGRQFESARKSLGSILFVVSLVGALIFAWRFSGRLHWTGALPVNWVVFGSSLMPIPLCFSAGLARRTQCISQRLRTITMFGLSGLAAAYLLTPVVRPVVSPIALSPNTKWSEGVCLQSHPSSCAPAAAVTLLRLSGVAAEEGELARACLTSQHGTEPVGLFRGLQRFAPRPYRSPRVASHDPEHWRERGQLPNISLVRFERSSSSTVRFQRSSATLNRLMGARGEGHAVVVLDRDAAGNWIIGDPAFGRTKWTDAQFRARFTGDAIFLAQTKTRFE